MCRLACALRWRSGVKLHTCLRFSLTACRFCRLPSNPPMERGRPIALAILFSLNPRGSLCPRGAPLWPTPMALSVFTHKLGWELERLGFSGRVILIAGGTAQLVLPPIWTGVLPAEGIGSVAFPFGGACSRKEVTRQVNLVAGSGAAGLSAPVGLRRGVSLLKPPSPPATPSSTTKMWPLACSPSSCSTGVPRLKSRRPNANRRPWACRSPSPNAP